nr:hypothetical protein [Tanacetum cinerariifolium]
MSINVMATYCIMDFYRGHLPSDSLLARDSMFEDNVGKFSPSSNRGVKDENVGESSKSSQPSRPTFGEDEIRNLVRDALGQIPSDSRGVGDSMFEDNVGESSQSSHRRVEDENVGESSKTSDDSAIYKKLLEECNKELYPELIRDVFPHLASLPSSVSEAKNLTKDLRLGYEKIDACPNDCMIYWDTWKDQTSCHVFNASRYKSDTADDIDFTSNPRSVRLGLASDGEEGPPTPLTGPDILEQLSGASFIYGKSDNSSNKSNKRTRDDGKTKDNENSRKGLMQMGIRHDLNLINRPNKKPYMPPTRYTMSSVENSNFLQVLKSLKVPDGYSSNISRGMSMKDRKLINLKSHDGHLLMQDIFPIDLRVSMLSRAKSRVLKVVPDAVEYVRSRAQPEGSLVEAYIKDECLSFCSRYFKGVEALFNRPPRNDEDILNKEMYILNLSGRKLGKVEIIELDHKLLAQAHRYVILNHTPRDMFNMGNKVIRDYDESYTQCMPYNLPTLYDVNEAPSWHRKEIKIEDDE